MRSLPFVLLAFVVSAHCQSRVSNPADPPAASPTGLIAGRVLDAEGRPAARVSIQVKPLRSGSDREASTSLSGEDGRFLFAGLPGGSYQVILGDAARPSVFAIAQLPAGMAGIELSARLPARTTQAPCSSRDCVLLSGLKASEYLHLLNTARPSQARPALVPAASTPRAAAAVPTTADFTIQTTVAAKAPPRFGFNFSANSPSLTNVYLQGGGMDPYDARLSLTANTAGAADTFIDNDCASGCEGTDFYQSLATGYFQGAAARVYRHGTAGWSLINQGTVTGYTANSASYQPADHTITLSGSGTPTAPGDAIWLSHDAVPSLPSFNLLDPRLQQYGYHPVWTFESGPILLNMSPVNPSAANPFPYTFDADGPPGDNSGAPGANQPLSLRLTSTTAGYAGIYQFFLNPDVGPGTTESLEPGHSYQLSVWLKQSAGASGTVTFTIGSFYNPLASHTFTGVTDQWQLFTYTFPGFPALPLGSSVPEVRFDFPTPATLWISQAGISDLNGAPNSIDPRAMSAWTSFAPGSMRIWSAFENTGGYYSFWSLDEWLADDGQQRLDPGIGNVYEIAADNIHLPHALALAKSVGAKPWLMANMSWSEQEWSNLIDYLAAPAGVGYAARRPASHPGPYTSDFPVLLIEFGNEEWGTQKTAVNQYYGDWIHYMLSRAIAGKSYFDPAKIRFIANGFTLIPYLGSSYATAAPEVSVVDFFSYNQGDATLSGDPYFQSDLVSLLRKDATYGASMKTLIDNMVAQQKADAAAGVKYDLAIYEGGPGQDSPSQVGDTSLAAAVGNLDVSLYAAQQGVQNQNFFLFNFGAGPYTSHSWLYDGLRPHPVWEALQMRNNYCAGDMVTVKANTVPLVASGVETLSGAGVYAFHEVKGKVHQLDIVVLSRDLKNSTPVTLHLPTRPSGSGRLYTLAGDPRQGNDASLAIPIASRALSGIRQTYSFSLPAGSVYLLQIPLTSWP